ncbi:MAG: DUF58 domain-containing protein [Erysipelotrichaceae bacterium]|nr:DUF58 domain-containing protein [Erysipelotrichaceae bacterium]MBR2545716.1 DUF58 domain-containing protein [Erysipelotrichaceae bacterium]MBR2745239.1 DUF58 domain-containing protein [Erysipelotrichaceae bacterium]
MIPFILVLLAVLITVIQIKAAPEAIKHLYYENRFDMKLAQPGEKITYTSKLINAWHFPVTYINLVEHMPETACIEGKKNNIDRHRMYLLAHHSYSHDIVFTLPERGVYKTGRYYLETGDYLGFKSQVKAEEIRCDLVVMPRESEDEVVINTLGGFIGDISVKRFIIEDPVLNIGYRDYTGREPMKDISWTQTARNNKLMVKNKDYTVDTNVAVVLNMKSENKEAKEECLRIVRTACQQLEDRRIPYEFISNGDVGNEEEGFGNRHFNSLMARCGKSNLYYYSSFEELIEKCIREKRNNRSYIIITPELDEAELKELDKLQLCSDHPLCVLYGREKKE